jgi:hypothetical protein
MFDKTPTRPVFRAKLFHSDATVQAQCHVEKRVRVFWADAGLSGAVGGVFNAE